MYWLRFVFFVLLKIGKQPFGPFFLFFVAKALVSSILAVVLSFKLLKRFDPFFARSLYHYDAVTVFTSRFGRTLTYATWVAKKEWFARGRQDVLAFDTRKGLSRTTVVLCWLCAVLVVLYLFDLVGIFIGKVAGWF
jgi:hypothetical protein